MNWGRFTLRAFRRLCIPITAYHVSVMEVLVLHPGALGVWTVFPFDKVLVVRVRAAMACNLFNHPVACDYCLMMIHRQHTCPWQLAVSTSVLGLAEPASSVRAEYESRAQSHDGVIEQITNLGITLAHSKLDDYRLMKVQEAPTSQYFCAVFAKPEMACRPPWKLLRLRSECLD